MEYTDFVTFDVDIDTAIAWVTFDYPPVNVQGLPMLADLNRLLWSQGYALANLGDIDHQTIAGAVATSTHGTGAARQSISSAVRGARILEGRSQGELDVKLDLA